MKTPLVLEIKGNSLDDGPGIRSVVFFKGCPLSCIWCHNPESKHAAAEISYDKELCIGCGTCVGKCPVSAVGPNKPAFVDRARCTLCCECVNACPAKAITKVGAEMTQEELLKKLLSDKPFYDISGGGVTLSGGEATLCTEWVGELARKLSENGVKVLIETCGFFDYDRVEKNLLPYVSDIYCDIKIFDREKHKKYCGVYNDRILENFRRMYADREKFGYNIMPRVPLIPDITDTDENLEAIADYMASCGVERTDLLPYNPTWYPKNDKLGISLAPELIDAKSFQPTEKLNHAKRIFYKRNIKC